MIPPQRCEHGKHYKQKREHIVVYAARKNDQRGMKRNDSKCKQLALVFKPERVKNAFAYDHKAR